MYKIFLRQFLLILMHAITKLTNNYNVNNNYNKNKEIFIDNYNFVR